MPEANAIPIQMEHLGLKHAVFQRFGELEEGGDHEPEMKFGLGTRLADPDRLVVEMTVEVNHQGIVEASVTYVSSFKRDPGTPPEEADKALEEWRFFAARVAPTVLFPYIRETLTTLALRSGLPALVLPILNFARVFDPAGIRFAEVGDDTEKTGIEG